MASGVHSFVLSPCSSLPVPTCLQPPQGSALCPLLSMNSMSPKSSSSPSSGSHHRPDLRARACPSPWGPQHPSWWHGPWVPHEGLVITLPLWQGHPSQGACLSSALISGQAPSGSKLLKKWIATQLFVFLHIWEGPLALSRRNLLGRLAGASLHPRPACIATGRLPGQACLWPCLTISVTPHAGSDPALVCGAG